MRSRLATTLVFAAGLVLATSAGGQTPPAPASPAPPTTEATPPATPPAAAPADPVLAHGQDVFNQRCADCHDPAVESAPDRPALAAFSPAFIIDTLKNGEMKPMALGLSDDDIAAVAAYLTKH